MIVGVAAEVCVNESIIDLLNMNIQVSFFYQELDFLIIIIKKNM